MDRCSKCLFFNFRNLARSNKILLFTGAIQGLRNLRFLTFENCLRIILEFCKNDDKFFSDYFSILKSLISKIFEDTFNHIQWHECLPTDQRDQSSHQSDFFYHSAKYLFRFDFPLTIIYIQYQTFPEGWVFGSERVCISAPIKVIFCLFLMVFTKLFHFNNFVSIFCEKKKIHIFMTLELCFDSIWLACMVKSMISIL